MAFTTIKPPRGNQVACPRHGGSVRLVSYRDGRRSPIVRIGAGAATTLGMTGPSVPMAVQIGSGEHEGLFSLHPCPHGSNTAKADGSGAYEVKLRQSVVIDAASRDLALTMIPNAVRRIGDRTVFIFRLDGQPIGERD